VESHTAGGSASSTNSRALQRRRSNPAVPAAPIRVSSDKAIDAIAKFCEQHPEYARLGVDVIEQTMATYRTEEEHAVRKMLADEGVPVGRWRRGDGYGEES